MAIEKQQQLQQQTSLDESSTPLLSSKRIIHGIINTNSIKKLNSQSI